MNFTRHIIKDKRTNAVVVLGSERPVRAFGKLVFSRNGDIVWIGDLLSYEGGADEHVTCHMNGYVARTSINRSDKYFRSGGRQSPQGARVIELSGGVVILGEEFVCEGLASFKSPTEGQILAECLDAMIIGSSMRFSIDILNGREEALIQSRISMRSEPGNHRQHVHLFEHCGRTLIFALNFKGGQGAVDEGKLAEADKSNLTYLKVCIQERMSVTDEFTVQVSNVVRDSSGSRK